MDEPTNPRLPGYQAMPKPAEPPKGESMNKHRKLQKLTISRETLGRLSPTEIRGVAGATGAPCSTTCTVTFYDSCNPYPTCTG